MTAVLYQQVLSGTFMMLIAIGVVLWWRRHAQQQWRWFWAGAAIWTVGVALKFAVAARLNPIIIGTGGSHNTGFVAGIIYCGLMTGVFEIGITLAAALIWRSLAADPKRAVAIGLGAGAFEAFLLGLAAGASCLVAVAAGQGDKVLSALSVYCSHTPLYWLAGPTERLFAIAAHVASRVLVFQAIAQRRWLGFWVGFAWLSLMDLLAGVVLLSGMTTSRSIWWSELILLPVGVLSIPLTRYALARWPKLDSVSMPEPLEAHVI